MAACLRKDPDARPSASDLLSHPFVLRHRNADVDMASFMRGAMDVHGQLDEIAFFFAHNFYRILTLGLAAPEHLAALAGLYVGASTFAHEGTRATGRGAISAAIAASVATLAAWGMKGFDARSVDCTGLGANGVLMSVQGDVVGGARPAPFAEVFALQKAPSGEFYVANQAFRLLGSAPL